MHSRIEKFNSYLQQSYKFDIKQKSESYLMTILNKILFFMNFNQFITTINTTIYIPEKELLEREKFIITIAHEFRHIYDSKRDKLFKFKYLFPQIMFLFFALLIPLSWWFLLPAFFCLAPLPAYWRMKYELEGYTMSLFVHNLFMKEQNMTENNRFLLLKDYAEEYNKHFVTFNYYLMWIFGVKKQLNNNIEKILDGSLEQEEIYSIISSAFKKSV
jgi:hypothetical protein